MKIRPSSHPRNIRHAGAAASSAWPAAGLSPARSGPAGLLGRGLCPDPAAAPALDHLKRGGTCARGDADALKENSEVEAKEPEKPQPTPRARLTIWSLRRSSTASCTRNAAGVLSAYRRARPIMDPDEVAAYFDNPARAQSMCDLLMRAFPTWVVWRQDHVWLARHRTWHRGRQPIADRTAGLLQQAIWETDIRGELA